MLAPFTHQIMLIFYQHVQHVKYTLHSIHSTKMYCHYFSIKENYMLRGRSQTTFANFANFQPPTYLCLDWLTFGLPPTYLLMLICDNFFPYIDMYLLGTSGKTENICAPKI